MNRNRLLNLLTANKARGQIFNEGNTIYLYDFIAGSEEEARYWGGVSAESFAKLLAGMDGDVHLRIDSPGGDVFGGRAIAQAMREYAGQIIVHIDGLAASAASYIAIAGDRVIAAPGAFMMIHKAWSLDMGNADDFRSTADLLDKIDQSIAASYAAKAGGDEEEWMSRMAAETWFTGAEALDLGLIDEVVDERQAKAKAKWDLSAFVNAPALQIEPDPAAQAAEEIAARKRQLAVALLSTPA